MIVGTEWIVEAYQCDAEKLRDAQLLRSVFGEIIRDLNLKVINEIWHQFEGEKGVTGLALLTESHLACHTYPEYQTATFNLYCCRERPVWDWEEKLRSFLGAESVNVKTMERGAVNAAAVSL
jgi:S-adenosylmethionine decarboxylase